MPTPLLAAPAPHPSGGSGGFGGSTAATPFVTFVSPHRASQDTSLESLDAMRGGDLWKLLAAIAH